ncbi:hypothetical protein [Paraflavitalea speifideaquila]|uniref:hypothetical protein n=1 Tax=Paraflavitalea speifideaquila TaxID=3076558 RepID=UPI0028ECBA81|nr:hypothetical protein [Paraflavitalea speifideiaquila]
MEIYQKVIALNPDFRDEEIDTKLRMPGGSASVPEGDDLDDDLDLERSASSYFLEKPTINFSDVGVWRESRMKYQ